MVGFHSKSLCFCGSDLQTGSQVLHVQDNIRGLKKKVLCVMCLKRTVRTKKIQRTRNVCITHAVVCALASQPWMRSIILYLHR